MHRPALQVRLLGAVDVTVNGVAHPVSGLRRKTVLAAIGLHFGETVSVNRLTQIVWDTNPPATAANTLQSHISYLRGVLGQRAAIVARPPGYFLNRDAGTTDVALAQQLIRQGEQATDHVESVARLRAALDLWRGQPMSDLVGATMLHEQAAQLEQLRLQAVEALIKARMALGEHVQLVPELEQLAKMHPFREHLHQQLMLALYRSGRQADALATYQQLRRSISHELGIDPGPALRDLEAAILRQDVTLDPPQPPIQLASTSPCLATPAQLPYASPTFAGRTAELAQLDYVLRKALRQRAGALARRFHGYKRKRPRAAWDGDATRYSDPLHAEFGRLRAEVEWLRAERTSLQWQIEHDELTGLPNRRFLYDAAPSLLHPTVGAAAMFVIDLNEFKAINDKFGHKEGDRVLRIIGERLSRWAGGNLVARLGGDEFAGVLAIGDPEAPRKWWQSSIEALSAAVAAPIRAGRHTLTVTASIGVAASRDDVPVATLLHTADQAMYAAKSSQRALAIQAAGTVGRPVRRAPSRVPSVRSYRPSGSRVLQT